MPDTTIRDLTPATVGNTSDLFYVRQGADTVDKSITSDLLAKINPRVILTVSTNTIAADAANTEYVYLCSGTMDFTLPAAAGNTNTYEIKNAGTGIITIIGIIDGGADPRLTTQYESITLVSNGTDWSIV